MKDFLQVGKITSTHGLKGEVKVYPLTEYPERFEEFDRVFLDTGKEKKQLEITNVRYFKNLVILKFKGIDDINDIEKYKGFSLWIDKEDAQTLGDNEYFVDDLLDMDVVLEDGSTFGVLYDVMETGANDVYVVKTPDNKEVLLPAIKECILDIDVENRKITVHLMPGLV